MQVCITTSPDKEKVTIHQISQKLINWNNSSDRKWLMNHLHWAVNNSHQVIISTQMVEGFVMVDDVSPMLTN